MAELRRIGDPVKLKKKKESRRDSIDVFAAMTEAELTAWIAQRFNGLTADQRDGLKIICRALWNVVKQNEGVDDG